MFWQWYIYLDDRRKFLWFYVWFSCRKSTDVKIRMRQGCQIDTFCRKFSTSKGHLWKSEPRSPSCATTIPAVALWLTVRHGTLRHGHSEDSERIGEVMGIHLLSWHVMTHFHSFSIPSTLLETTTGITCRSRAAAVPAGEGWLELVRSTTFCQDGWVAHVEFWGPRRWSLGPLIQSLKMQWKCYEHGIISLEPEIDTTGGPLWTRG